MRAPPLLRGSLATRLVALVLGLAVFATGVFALLESDLGLAPWDVLHDGLAERTPLSFGQASIVVGLLVLVLAWSLGARVGVGTFANAILIGLFVELLLTVDTVTALSDQGVAVRVALLIAGVALMAIGTALYLGAGLGAGPRDSLMVVGARRTPVRIGAVRAAIELTVLGVGFALGGVVGVGTVVFALTIGPLAESCFWILSRLGLTRPQPAQNGPGESEPEAEQDLISCVQPDTG